MKLVEFVPEVHYSILSYWWQAHGWTPPALDHLPEGYVIESRGSPVAAGFVYRTGTRFCLFEWIVASPEAGLKERAQALDVLISAVRLLLKQAGIKSIFMSVKHDGLIAKLTDDHGFVKAESGMVNLVGRV